MPSDKQEIDTTLHEIITSEVRKKYNNERGAYDEFANLVGETSANLFYGLKVNPKLNKLQKYAEALGGSICFKTKQGEIIKISQVDKSSKLH